MTQNNLPAQSEEESKLLLPKLSFSSVTFSSGTKLEFDQDEIVVFVGPNNAGKSAALREMQDFVARNGSQKVIKDASFHKVGKSADLRLYLEKYAQRIGGNGEYKYVGIGYNIHQNHMSFFDNLTDRHPVAPFFCTRLATEDRITSSNAAGPIALYQAPPTHPIHLLLMDEKLADKISGFFRHAFGMDLIPFRAGGASFPLYVGDRPKKAEGEDELSKSFVEKLQSNAVPLDQQGDGMRSFVAVLLYVLAADNHSIQLLDEPEAFLHPPQARLIGEFIARERLAKSQLFIATHSTDILEGLIAGGANKVRIIRIQRDGTVNQVKELSKERTAAIANDTLSRYSGVFSGIFYQHVVICESDADCLFYGSILNTKAVSGEERADVLFIHTSGKHRMAQLAATLRELDVPVSVIADVDLLSEENPCKGLFETLGGTWANVVNSWKSIKNSVEARRPPLNAEQVSKLIGDELANAQGTGEFPKSSETAIKRIFKTLSSWDDIKRAGRAALPAGQTVQHYDSLISSFSKIGLWIVPVGELEGFCRSIDAGHGPSFVAKVLEERNLETDSELTEARKFILDIWTGAKVSVKNKLDRASGESDEAANSSDTVYMASESGLSAVGP